MRHRYDGIGYGATVVFGMTVLFTVFVGIIARTLTERRLNRQVKFMSEESDTAQPSENNDISAVRELPDTDIRDLRESEVRHRELFEANPHPMWIFDLETLAFLEVNEAAIRAYGYSRETFQQMTLLDIRPTEDFSLVVDSIANTSGRLNDLVRARHYTSDGRLIDVEVSFHFLEFNGRQAALAAINDVEERNRAQNALRTREAEFRTLVETMPQIVWVTRPDGWHIDFNQCWLDYTGLTLEESLGFGWNPPFHPEDRGRAAERWLEATNSGEPYEIEYRLRRWDGVYHWMLGRAVPMRDAEGNIVKWFGTCTDIDDLKRTQERLDEAQLVGKIGDWEYNPHTEETVWSPILYKLLGRDSRLGPPKTLDECASLFHSESASLLKEMVSLVTESGRTQRFDLRRNEGDGEDTYVQVIAVPRKHDSGEVVGLFGTVQDISERKQAELALYTKVQQQRLIAALGRFALSAACLDEVYTEAELTIMQGLKVEFSEDSRFALSELIASHGVASRVDVLVDAFEQSIGVLGAHSVETRKFSADDVGFLQEVANILGAAVERQRANERLSHMALHDPLTDLPNRSLLTDRINVALSNAERHHKQVALLFLDLDRFKHVNDVFGHALGDLLLHEVAKRLSRCVRSEDTVSRQGGDEFVVALAGIENEQDAAVIADKLLTVITSPFILEETEIILGISIGIACFPRHGKDVVTLLRNADAAIYVAKELGRNRYQFYQPEMNMRALERLTLGSDLHQVVARNELFLMYQPQFALSTGDILGVEALVRWQHPSRGLISPCQFIPIAEDSGLIVQIGNWVLEAACEQHARWMSQGLTMGSMAVNISAHQFRQANFCDLISDVISRTGIQPDLLELEVTEGVVMQGIDEVLHKLNILRGLGVTLAIDDFGTGYSSLSYLKQFPLHRLKIDQSFSRELPGDQGSSAIAKAIIEMGHSLGLDVLAEGIETKEQEYHLKMLGCDAGQGFLYAKPLSAEDCEHYLRGASSCG
ncbi:MAG: EAL domain-containing protein [Marinobacter sp.]